MFIADNSTGDFMEKRVIAVFLSFCLIMGTLCLRLYTVTTQSDAVSYISSHYKKITLDTLRLPIYDCNGKPLVNQSTENFVVAKPTETALSLLYEMLPTDKFDEIATALVQGSAGYVSLGDEVLDSCTSFVTLKKNIRYSSNPRAVHLVGYINSDGDGVSGIERCFDSLLKTDIPLYAGFLCDVNGDIVDGAEIETNYKYNTHNGGVSTTLDIDFQSIAEEELRASRIKKGAVVVSDVKTGEIKALASIPTFDPNNVKDYLDETTSPFSNRALSAYPVGSVFKVAVAACALENGIDKSFSFNCSGAITVEGNTFHCNNSTAHGKLDMESALALSCNCYFIELSKELGGKAILETASLFGFGQTVEIAKDLYSSQGKLPSGEALEISGNLANFSFGQGAFTATPVQMINVFNAIANSGKYTPVYCVNDAKDADGNMVYSFKAKAPVHAISKETANLLLTMLTTVVKEGTARNAQTEGFDSAGKTATAQTGVYNQDGTEQLCTWFGGFFPADNPRYSVIVLAQDGTTGGTDCAPVFKSIAQRIIQRK